MKLSGTGPFEGSRSVGKWQWIRRIRSPILPRQADKRVIAHCLDGLQGRVAATHHPLVAHLQQSCVGEPEDGIVGVDISVQAPVAHRTSA
ncbi:hypothetical protein AM571_PC01528 (plasmid) [Rhizobium etli 8C-3]|uniref:Uncharacterized protein n=1 Tax=Rhizobium etli 8C-3 TaxID=538025 RepID=A0A1L5PGV7_RHIET|nr:hypothetical protein AM571_PC01528 [Rhizobium etli 8C-3]